MSNRFDAPAGGRGYVAPALARLGSLEGVTHGHKDGGKTDKFFPAGTPRGDITFS